MRFLLVVLLVISAEFLQAQSFETSSFFATTNQNGVITGQILDSETANEPLPMASILVKDTDVNCTSSLDGTFKLNLKPGNYTLEVSFIGYKTVEINAIVLESSKTVFQNIIMSPLEMDATAFVASMP